ncbi:hypothetical protein ACROYT_G040891 [Oculina patagonica]
MTSSSQYDNRYEAFYGRLNGDRGDGWCAKEANRNDDWLQIDLGKSIEVCAVATQGDRNGNEWATDFTISYSSHGISWKPYKGPNDAVVEFHRKGDSNTIDQHNFPVPEPARYIRFHPTKQHRWNCLRVEVYGMERQCRHLEFTAARVFKGKRLVNHVIHTADVMDEGLCRILCFSDSNCVSYNFMRGSEPGKHKCELNNATHEEHKEDLEENLHFVHRGATNACMNNLCKNNATCQTGFTDKGYRCLCFPGFTGQDCESGQALVWEMVQANSLSKKNLWQLQFFCNELGLAVPVPQPRIVTCYVWTCMCELHSVSGKVDIDECAGATHTCSADAVCTNTKGSYNCTCKPGYEGDGRDCEDIDECATGRHDCGALEQCHNTKGSYDCPSLTCKDIYDGNLSNVDKAYQMKVGPEIILVYCHLNKNGLGACGVGGWTLVMKIDGTQSTFHYDSSLWTNKDTFNLAGGETGFDTEETKLPTYWSTPFSKICLGIKIDGEETTRFVVIQKTADSLYSLIADGQFRATSLGRDTWKALLGSQGSLQLNCNREGFNAVSDSGWAPKARIGILGNNEDECASCDSRIGFGTGGLHDNSNTCGIDVKYGGDNGDRSIKTMGYIWIQ